MQKVVVTNGEINTKLTFHVDATDAYSRTADSYQTRSRGWGGSASSAIGGFASRILSTATANATAAISGTRLNVAVVNEKSSSATNISIDIIGEVRIQFRTETFPAVEG
jgi:hypothetical protein